MKNLGLINVAAVSPRTIEIGNPVFNANYMLELIEKTIEEKPNTNIIVFPELSLTGYTCGDLLLNSTLINSALNELEKIVKYFKERDNMPICFIGLPIRKDNQLFNCAAAVSSDGLLAIIPKTFIPNYSEFYEMRYFASANKRMSDEYNFFGEIVPFTPNVIINDKSSEAKIAIEICEDAWVPIPPSAKHVLHGANIIVNLSASNETIAKRKYREDLIRMHSATSICGYVYTSASRDESTTDTVFSGNIIVAENGSIKEKTEFLDDKEIVYAQIDVEKIENDRARSTSFMECADNEKYNEIYTTGNEANKFELYKPVSLTPFVPKNINERCNEILKIQAAGLAQRLKKIGCKKVVLGISGGLDSTLALIVAVEAFNINNYPLDGIIGITMPCFGTTKRTKNNATKLMDELKITSYEIDIKKACEQHYKDIDHDPSLLDITFENVQARERTQILMDMANKHNALVVGTGDLSELALGWCTYNGDHMSMYSVNGSIPKTLVRYLVKTTADNYKDKGMNNISEVLYDIYNTPISPELLPPDKDGNIVQKTEESIGSYNIHDFVLYYMLRFGFGPKKIYNLYVNSWISDDNEITEDQKQIVINNMRTFYRRFFTQQFKRNCVPDGVKVGSVSLSPRADWRMPSDATAKLWLEELNRI